jgi:hypothetical protein
MKMRWVLAAVALLVVAFGGWLSVGEPRLTMVNAGIEVTYPWPRGAGALLVALGLAALAGSTPKAWSRILAGGLAALSLWVGLHLLTYRLDTNDSGIRSRAHLVESEMAWKDVVDVGLEPTVVVVAGRDERRIFIDTTDYTPDQRAALNRTIARRITELGTLNASR